MARESEIRGRLIPARATREDLPEPGHRRPWPSLRSACHASPSWLSQRLPGDPSPRGSACRPSGRSRACCSSTAWLDLWPRDTSLVVDSAGGDAPTQAMLQIAHLARRVLATTRSQLPSLAHRAATLARPPAARPEPSPSRTSSEARSARGPRAARPGHGWAPRAQARCRGS